MPMCTPRLWRNKRRIQQLSAVLLAVLPLVTAAVELEQLHLPKSYLRYLPELLDGGELVASTERCQQFISGTLSLDKSSPDEPVFLYTCRDDSQQTYSLLVEGNSLEILDPSRPSGRVSFAELQAEIDRQRERERARAAAEAAVIAELQQERAEVRRLREQEIERQALEQARLDEIARRERLWEACRVLLREQTRNMLEVSWLTQVQPEAEKLGDKIDENDAAEQRYRFAVDFDAVDPQGTPLAYRAYCQFGAEDEVLTHSIHPRSLQIQKSAP